MRAFVDFARRQGVGQRAIVDLSRSVVDHAARALLPRAMSAAVDDVIFLDAMPQDPATAMRTGRRKFLGRALETVERVALSCHRNREGLVVVVPANVASRHDVTFRLAPQ